MKYKVGDKFIRTEPSWVYELTTRIGIEMTIIAKIDSHVYTLKFKDGFITNADEHYIEANYKPIKKGQLLFNFMYD